jgi:hypothetical protein
VREHPEKAYFHVLLLFFLPSLRGLSSYHVIITYHGMISHIRRMGRRAKWVDFSREGEGVIITCASWYSERGERVGWKDIGRSGIQFTAAEHTLHGARRTRVVDVPFLYF